MILNTYIEEYQEKGKKKNSKIIKNFLFRNANVKENKIKKIDLNYNKENKIEQLKDSKKTLNIDKKKLNINSNLILSQSPKEQKQNIIRRNKNKINNKNKSKKIEKNILPQVSTFIFDKMMIYIVSSLVLLIFIIYKIF